MGDSAYTMLLMLIPFALLYFFMVRPQKKKEQAQAEMRNDIAPGDRVITIGGIVGRVVNVKEDTITIETGSEKTRLKMMKAAISQREGKDEQPAITFSVQRSRASVENNRSPFVLRVHRCRAVSVLMMTSVSRQASTEVVAVSAAVSMRAACSCTRWKYVQG